MSAPRSKLLLVDLAVAASMPLLALWVYEITNLAVLAAQGDEVTLSIAGWIPLGVAGVSQGGLLPLTKVLQMGLAAGLILPLRWLFARSGLRVAETFVLSTLGVYLASAYWEVLSLVTTVSMEVHSGIFIAGTAVLAFALLWAFDDSRSIRTSSQPGLAGLHHR